MIQIALLDLIPIGGRRRTKKNAC